VPLPTFPILRAGTRSPRQPKERKFRETSLFFNINNSGGVGPSFARRNYKVGDLPFAVRSVVRLVRAATPLPAPRPPGEHGPGNKSGPTDPQDGDRCKKHDPGALAHESYCGVYTEYSGGYTPFVWTRTRRPARDWSHLRVPLLQLGWWMASSLQVKPRARTRPLRFRCTSAEAA
jgi:hypothetical protein